jgi:hypothetical protein
MHKLGCLFEPTCQNQRSCDREGTHGFLELLVGTLHILRSFPCSTKNYLSLAYELANGATVGLGKLFLREVYRYLHLMSSSLLFQKRLKTGGPWWFIQLWTHLYFQSYILNFPVLADNSFSDQTGRHIRCTSYGEALYCLPGSKLNLKDASG